VNTVDVIHRHSRQATERSSVGDVVGENHEWPNLGSKSKTLGGECIRHGLHSGWPLLARKAVVRTEAVSYNW
jgi:hypothetical protein